MGRPRKDPQEGETMNVQKVTFENECFTAQIGTRKYMLVPKKSDVPFTPITEISVFQGAPKDSKTFGAFEALNNVLISLTDQYERILEVKNEISKYMDQESETAHDTYHRWEMPSNVFYRVGDIINDLKRDTETKTELARFEYLMYEITQTKSEIR